ATPLQPRMGSVTVVVTPELEELHLQIGGSPEQGAVQAFPSNRANESFDEWMRDRRVRHRLDLFHAEYPQIRLPLVESVKRIMVRAEVSRRRLATSRSIEHSAQPHAINDAAMH